MSSGSHRGPLPLLNVSEEEAWKWRQHRLATSQAYEVLFCYPVPFEDLASTDDAFEEVSGVQRLTLRAAKVLRRVFTSHASGETDVGTAEPVTRAAHRTELLHLIDTIRTGDGANLRPLSSLRVLRTWRSTSRRSSL
jgi:hypothetical protein